MAFHRREQMTKLKRVIHSIVRLKRIEKYLHDHGEVTRRTDKIMDIKRYRWQGNRDFWPMAENRATGS